MIGELIGRDDELAVITDFLDRPGAGPRALVLEGEPGIGKSTLWNAGVAAARERSWRVLTSRPAEIEQTLPYVALGDLFRNVEPEAVETLPVPRRRAFESVLLREEAEVPVDPRALGVAILTLLTALAAERPVLLAIDDDQWLDSSSATNLTFALRRADDLPILLLLSRRPGEGAGDRLEAAVDPARVQRLRIGPLSVGGIQLLIARRLGRSFPRPILLSLHEVSGGNPFYALELARARLEDPSSGAALRWAVPSTLERLVAARIEALDRPTRRTLLLLAAHGRLPLALLPAIEISIAVVDSAVAARLIEISDGALHFTHPLLASALYQASTPQERRAAHRRLGEAVADPVHRGRHLALAAAAPEPGLADALDAAAEDADRRGMPIAAADLAEHALRLTQDDAEGDWCRRAVAAARAHLATGEAQRARSLIEAILARAPSGPQRAEALILSGQLAGAASGLALFGEALAEAAGFPRLEAAIHGQLAMLGRLTHDRTWLDRHARTAVEIADRLDDPGLRADANSTLALLQFDRGDPRALELAEEAYRLAQSQPDLDALKRAGGVMSHLVAWSGTTERARGWLERELAAWQDRDEQARGHALWYLALVELWSGRWSLASSYAREARELDVQYGVETPQDHLPSALIALHRGDLAIARQHSRRALAIAAGQQLPAHMAILAVCDAWSGDDSAAVQQFAIAEQTADARGWDEPLMRWWEAEHVEALLRVGHIGDASRALESWEAAAKARGRERVLAAAIRCRGLLAAAHGDINTAVELLETAANRHESVPDPFGRARALLALGVLKRRARQKRAARAALEAAVQQFEALGALSWLDTARRELASVGGATKISGLSPSEVRVASLVAQGLTNREIATTLFLGERTVASHLSHIYAKLGIRSRTELAGQLIAHAEPSEHPPSNIPQS